jgi:hydrogenase maturation factor
VALHADHAGEAANALNAAGVPAARIGRVLPPIGASVTVR